VSSEAIQTTDTRAPGSKVLKDLNATESDHADVGTSTTLKGGKPFDYATSLKSFISSRLYDSHLTVNNTLEGIPKHDRTVISGRALGTHLEHKQDKQNTRAQGKRQQSENSFDPLSSAASQENLQASITRSGIAPPRSIGELSSRTSNEDLDAIERFQGKGHMKLSVDVALFVKPVPASLRGPYQSAELPSFISLGENFNPFGTLFRNRYNIVPMEQLKFLRKAVDSLDSLCANRYQTIDSLLPMEWPCTGTLPCYRVLTR
jgi:hypothetical protein